MPRICIKPKAQNQSRPGETALTGIPRKETTLRPPVIPEVQTFTDRPEFIRLPKSGTPCPHCGLSRSTLNSCILPSAANGYKPPVHSHVLRQPGRLRGIRLIDFESLCAYIRSQCDGSIHSQKPRNILPFAKDDAGATRRSKVHSKVI